MDVRGWNILVWRGFSEIGIAGVEANKIILCKFSSNRFRKLFHGNDLAFTIFVTPQDGNHRFASALPEILMSLIQSERWKFFISRNSRARFSAFRGWMGDDLCEKCGESETSRGRLEFRDTLSLNAFIVWSEKLETYCSRFSSFIATLRSFFFLTVELCYPAHVYCASLCHLGQLQLSFDIFRSKRAGRSLISFRLGKLSSLDFLFWQ